MYEHTHSGAWLKQTKNVICIKRDVAEMYYVKCYK